MTEKEKQQAGELYDASDRELFAERVKARKLCAEFNALEYNDFQKRERLIDRIVALKGIDTFLCRNTSDAVAHVLVGRVNVDCDIPASVRRCLAMVGRPYDDLYLPGDSAVYCSELVQMNYVTAAGTLVLDPVPMSFHDQSGAILQYWRDFYSTRGLAVPEGEPGSNPGELSRRNQVTIIGKYPRQL